MSVRMWFLLGIIAVTACEGCVDWNFIFARLQLTPTSHSLRGLCGLKSMGILVYVSMCMSQPARAVWIEISSLKSGWAHGKSQPARAVWIEIPYIKTNCHVRIVTACEGCVDWNSTFLAKYFGKTGHSLRGLCGLKLYGAAGIDIFSGSQPARAVWIEIAQLLLIPK